MNLCVIGASGKMGKNIISLSGEEGFTVVSELGREIGNLDKFPDGVDVVIDFSLPEATAKVIELCKSSKLPLVSGVTGLTDDQYNQLQTAGKEIAVLWSPNMSLGVAMFRRMLREFQAAKNWDFQMIETHHTKKQDSPSGTAKMLMGELEKATQKSSKVSDMRLGNVYGVHQLFAVGPEEEIEITHRALDRKLFARGALQVAKWLVSQTNSAYTMEDYIESIVRE
ncbi:MAG: 4-hydroxy-tetrahydrodipicolinate reductase [Bdellovibrionales bacterium]